MNRYSNQSKFRNTSDKYNFLFDERDVNSVEQYELPLLTHPTIEERRDFEKIAHIWSLGDRFYKLAHEHYGDSTLWWVIAWYNQRPTEHHVSPGDIVFIPQPLDEVLRSLEV